MKTKKAATTPDTKAVDKKNKLSVGELAIKYNTAHKYNGELLRLIEPHEIPKHNRGK